MQYAIADSFGRYSIDGVELLPGANPISVLATDPAGNTRTVDVELVFVDGSGPTFDLALANDTGRSETDRCNGT